MTRRFGFVVRSVALAAAVAIVLAAGSSSTVRAMSDPGSHTPWNDLGNNISWAQGSPKDNAGYLYIENNNATRATVTVTVEEDDGSNDTTNQVFNLNLPGFSDPGQAGSPDVAMESLTYATNTIIDSVTISSLVIH